MSGSWNVTATPLSSTCGTHRSEPFGMSVVQNGDILQFVVPVEGFGPVRYDGWIDRDGAFRVGQRTVYASRALEDRSVVDGAFSFSGRSLSGTETETITDLRTGDACRIRWRWRGTR